MARERCTYKPVRVVRGEIVVTCHLCGPSEVKRPIALAKALEGPLGRFETSATRDERLRLASEIRRVVARRRKSKKAS
jgi:hypothetical protein